MEEKKERIERERPVREREEVKKAEPTQKPVVTIRLGAYGQSPKRLSFYDKKTTLGQALKDKKREGLTARVNGRPQKDDYVLQDEDIVTLLPQVRGGLG